MKEWLYEKDHNSRIGAVSIAIIVLAAYDKKDEEESTSAEAVILKHYRRLSSKDLDGLQAVQVNRINNFDYEQVMDG